VCAGTARMKERQRDVGRDSENWGGIGKGGEGQREVERYTERWGGTGRAGIAIILDTPAVTALLLYNE